MALLSGLGIRTVIDVGASWGQFGDTIRRAGYSGRIISFEPLSDPYQRLLRHTAQDPLWDCINIALSDTEEDSVSSTSPAKLISSSILPMLPQHEKSAPKSAYVDKEQVRCLPLDSLWDDLAIEQPVYLKIDVQGFEKTVLDGARVSLPECKAVQLELSLVPLYDGQSLLWEIVGFMSEIGFDFLTLERGFSNMATGDSFKWTARL